MRHQLWTCAQQGLSTPAIVQTLRIAPRTARRLLQRSRALGQPAPANYDACGRPPTAAFQSLRREILAWRRLHPGWGAGRLRAELRRQHPHEPLPSVSTLRRWLAEAGLTTPMRPPIVPWPRADRPHQVWQMDAAEKIPLRTKQSVCWLRLVDEASGAALASFVTPQGCWGEVGGPAVQQMLRCAFARWGRPQGLRVDNGRPWVSKEGPATDLELWLAGLDVGLHRNPPRRPQANAKGERGQRTARAWADPEACDTPEPLQQRLDEEDRVQREVFVLADGRSRLEAYPELRHSGRGYAAASCWEDICWDFEAALACLARRSLGRKVDQSGSVSLYDHKPYVGKAYAGQRVEVRLVVATREWSFALGDQEVGRAAAKRLTAETIRQLQLSRRPGRSAQRTRQKRREEAASAARVSPADAEARHGGSDASCAPSASGRSQGEGGAAQQEER